jgi:thiol-disulfide isomerase/thioredoxin
MALGAATLACAEAPIRPWAGKATPPLARPDLQGRRVDLAAMHGRVVLVNFWATWCEPCRAEMPSIERLRSKLKGRPFDVLTVNYGESRAKAAAFMGHEKLDLPVLLDPDNEASDAWGAKGLPMTFLVDARGSIRYYAFGERDWSGGESLALVERLLAEAPGARR